jgi:hypothetical protein
VESGWPGARALIGPYETATFSAAQRYGGSLPPGVERSQLRSLSRIVPDWYWTIRSGQPATLQLICFTTPG